MSFDIRHIRGANLDPTAWTTLDEARAALEGGGYDNALMQNLYQAGSPANANESDMMLTGLLRLTHDHRVYVYYVAGGVVQELTLVFGFA